MTTSQPTVLARELYRFYRAGNEETLALRGTSASAAAGEVVVVTGPSGSGKSTLLACLAGLDEPDGGAVFLDGVRLSHRSERERSAIRAAGVGVLFQTNNLVPHLTVLGNLRLAQRLVSTSDRPRPGELLAAVGLAARGHARPGELSGGENARAGLAVAVANAPRALVADEPTGELDERTEQAVLDLLRAQARRGCAVVVASHSPAVADAGDRVLRMSEGRIEEEVTRR